MVAIAEKASQSRDRAYHQAPAQCFRRLDILAAYRKAGIAVAYRPKTGRSSPVTI